MSCLFSRKKSILAAIIAIATFFRFYRLDALPPGFQFDQAFYVFDILRLLQGQFYIFFAAPGGTEPLYIYLAMVGGALFGATPLGLKLTAATISVLTIPLIYGLARTLFSPSPSQVEDPRSGAEGRESRKSSRGGDQSPVNTNHARDDLRRGEGAARIAALSALFAAISLWSIFFARYGERVTLLVMLTVLVYWFFWRALDLHVTRHDCANFAQPAHATCSTWHHFALVGFFLALALYTYPGSRVLPIALILLTAYATLTDRANSTRYIKGLLLAFVVTAIVFLPLGIYYAFHPDQFIGHTAEVSIFVPHGAETGDVGAALVQNAVRLLGMFFVTGDSGVLRNTIPSRPIFDPFVGALFVVGVIVWLVVLLSPRSTPANRKRAMFLAVWLATAHAISLFSDDAPNFVRTLPAMPAVMILPAWGASAIWERLHTPMLRRAATVAMGVIALTSAGLSYRDYFVVFANDPETYYTFDTDKVETSNWLNQNAQSQYIFIAPLLAQNSTISLLTRNAPLKSFESRDTIILPSNADGKDALFAFPWEQDKKVQTMAERLGALGLREELDGSNGGKLLLIYRVPVQNLPDAQNPLNALARGGDFIQPQKTTHAVWSDSFELLGYSIDAADAAKRNLQVTLLFHALKPISEDYTFSIKARDAQDRTWGQEDKWAGDNSYATTQMSVGDLVIERFYPGLNACAPAGDYRITVEAYDPKTSQVLALSSGGDFAELDATHADASSNNRLEDLEPAQTLDAKIGERLQLIGYTLTPDEARAGEPFSLSLFWRGVGQGSSESVSVRLQDAAKRDVLLAQGSVNIPVEGRGLCAFYDLTVPSGVQPGAATLWVNNSKFAEMTIK
jgi:hypothetical protein